MGGRRRNPERDPASEAMSAAIRALAVHPLFAPLVARVHIVPSSEGRPVLTHGWAVATSRGHVLVHPTRLAKPDEWIYVIAHALLHIGFGHVVPKDRPREWNVACCLFVERFLRTLKLGRPPDAMRLPEIPAASEDKLYARFCEDGLPFAHGAGTNEDGDDLDVTSRPTDHELRSWEVALADGLGAAVERAVHVAGGHLAQLSIGAEARSTPAQRARSWFLSSYPLLGAMASAFELVEDVGVCQRMQIQIAAVDAGAREIYVNPAAGLDELEARFVIAHELLHVGLRHHARTQGRDPWLWNVACDYVINGWLVEMQVGAVPRVGVLHEPEWKGLSAESIYDRLVGDLRKLRKLATLRGVGLGDLLERRPGWWSTLDGLELDAWFRRCMGQGLGAHESQSRGLLPAGLVEEIRALDQPPIPWDVELAQWFDQHFAPIEPRRSYARPSRRQSASPDLPRPRVIVPQIPVEHRTFGVLLDTSGSMDRSLLAKALGAIASYAASRDVPAARVVFCDASPYDEGYLAVEQIAGRVRVRGRGGTVLQPGIDLLEAAKDFPKDGPILVITDGECDRVRIRREHAFLVPEGARLPFGPQGPVFRIR